MQGPALHMIIFESRKATDRQVDLRNEYIFLFGDGVSPGEKSRKTASLRVAHDAVSVFFFSGDSPITKHNK
jgi:hypothetical protein